MDQSEEIPKNFEPKSLKDILIESLYDISGFNRGVLRTLIDIIRQPAKVIAGYHQNDFTYTRPVAFCLITSGAYLLLANYVINWDVYVSLIVEFYLWFVNLVSPNQNPSVEELNLVKKWSELGVDILFKKYFVVMVIAQAFFRAAVFTKFKEDASYGNMLVIMLYRQGGSIFISAVSLLCFLIPNAFGFISYMVVVSLADQFAFKNYINLTLGQGSKKPFQKRILKAIAIIGILYILFVGIVALYLFFK